jgi:hypothetical protein
MDKASNTTIYQLKLQILAVLQFSDPVGRECAAISNQGFNYFHLDDKPQNILPQQKQLFCPVYPVWPILRVSSP